MRAHARRDAVFTALGHIEMIWDILFRLALARRHKLNHTEMERLMSCSIQRQSSFHHSIIPLEDLGKHHPSGVKSKPGPLGSNCLLYD